MRFYFGEPTATLTAEDQQRWRDTFADVIYACGECRSEDTREHPSLVPSGQTHRVVCEQGHVTVGVPPRRFRRDGQAPTPGPRLGH